MAFPRKKGLIMETPSGLSFLVHVSINSFFYLKRKIFGRSRPDKAKGPASLSRLPFFFSAIIVLIVLFFGIFSTGFLVFKGLTSHSDLSLVDQFQHLPSPFGETRTYAAGNGQAAEISQPAFMPVDIPANSEEIVNAGEEIRDAVYRQLEVQVSTDPAKWGLAESDIGNKEKFNNFLGKKVSEILAKNGIVKKGSLQTLTVNPGTKVVLDQEGGVKIFGDSYFKKMDNASAGDLQALRI